MSQPTLLIFLPVFGLRSASPFCLKADAQLAMAGAKYTVRLGDVRKSPSGKLPVLLDEGETVTDSRKIRSHIEKKLGVDLDAGLDARERAIALTTQRAIEEHLYFAIIKDRWMGNPDVVREAFFGSVPSLMRKTVFSVVRKTVEKSLHGQGFGRLTETDARALIRADVGAIAALFQGPYFFGERRSAVDAVVYAFLASALTKETPGPAQEIVREHGELVDFVARFGDEVFADAPPVPQR